MQTLTTAFPTPQIRNEQEVFRLEAESTYRSVISAWSALYWKENIGTLSRNRRPCLCSRPCLGGFQRPKRLLSMSLKRTKNYICLILFTLKVCGLLHNIRSVSRVSWFGFSRLRTFTGKAWEGRAMVIRCWTTRKRSQRYITWLLFST